MSEAGDPGGGDIINDFSQTEGDKIDLSGFTGNFQFLGFQNRFEPDAFQGSGTPSIKYITFGPDVFIIGDSNGDGVRDFSIGFRNITFTFEASDFIL